MAFKIELRYWNGWDDAEWTEDRGDGEQPVRFESIEAAEIGIAEFFAEVRAAVAAGNMDVPEVRDDYRIVEAVD